MSTNEENRVKHDPQRAGTTGGTPRTESMSQVTTSKLSPDSSTCTRSDSFFQEDSDYHPPHGCRRVPPPLPAPVKSSSTSHDSPKSAIVHPAVTGEPDIPPISPKSHADAPDLRRVAPNKTAPLGQSSSNPSESRNSHRSLTEDTVGTSRLERVNSRPPSPPTPPNTPADPVGSSWNGAPTLHFLSVSSSSSRTVTGRRSAVGPSWAVPPRVLLVDDDAVNRTLSSKFLQVYGCSIDVATDGFGAVDKMNGKKYDLVLMVCVRGHCWVLLR